MRTASVVALLLLVAGRAGADTAFWLGDVPPSSAVRLAQVREWLDGFRALDKQVPTLSPAEAAWLQTEYDDQIASANGTFTPRAITAARSVEYHKRAVRERLDDILINLDILSSPRGLGAHREAYVWSGVAAGMMDPELWSSMGVLIERKIVQPEINGVAEHVMDTHVMWAHRILTRVVRPLLRESER